MKTEKLVIDFDLESFKFVVLTFQIRAEVLKRDKAEYSKHCFFMLKQIREQLKPIFRNDFDNLINEANKLIETERKNWYEENAPLGKKLGYPECCINEFCNEAPNLITAKGEPSENDNLRYAAACIEGKYTGFIPCLKHALQITSGEIKLKDLIINRDPGLGEFPNSGMFLQD